MRNVAVDGADDASAFFEREDGREAVASVEIVLDDVGVEAAVGNQRIVDDVAGVADERVEGRFVLTDAQTTELDPGEVQRDALAAGRIAIESVIERVLPDRQG